MSSLSALPRWDELLRRAVKVARWKLAANATGDACREEVVRRTVDKSPPRRPDFLEQAAMAREMFRL